MKAALIVAMLLIIGNVYALPAVENLDIKFEINDDLSVSEEIGILFADALNGSFTFTLNGDVEGIDVSGDGQSLTYGFKRAANSYLLEVMSEGKADIIIKFVSRDFVFVNGDINQFFTNLNFDVDINTLTAELILPEGYGIVENSFTPDGVVTTNGKNIIIKWTLADNNAVFSVKFEELNKRQDLWIYVVGILVMIVLAGMYYHRKKNYKAFIYGFREDEKNVIQYLKKHRLTYQNIVEKEFKFSRAKMTRIMKHLESKGLIEKKKYGRTNKIKWKK